MALQAGQLFGNYRLVRLIGEGGFGEVYLAENPIIERRAAVKVLHTALAQDAELVRLCAEETRYQVGPTSILAAISDENGTRSSTGRRNKRR